MSAGLNRTCSELEMPRRPRHPWSNLRLGPESRTQTCRAPAGCWGGSEVQVVGLEHELRELPAGCLVSCLSREPGLGSQA